MKILFIISCVLLYLILGRLYVELMVLPNLGNPKDYSDLYRGMMLYCRPIGNEWWTNSEKEYGKSWEIVWVKIIVCVWSLMAIVFILVDMKLILVKLINFLK